MNANLRPSDIPLICRALQVIADKPDSFFDGIRPDIIPVLKSSARELSVKLRFHPGSFDHREIFAVYAACNYAQSLSGFSPEEKQTLLQYEGLFHALIVNHNMSQ